MIILMKHSCILKTTGIMNRGKNEGGLREKYEPILKDIYRVGEDGFQRSISLRMGSI